MAFVSVTRLRLRSVRFLPVFAVHTLRSLAQVRRSPGFHGGALLPDRQWTFWTMTLWDSSGAMRQYRNNSAHLTAMKYLMHWCDEASYVHWEQAAAAVPAWSEADTRMRSEGHVSKVNHPSPRHADLTYREPRLGFGGPIHPAEPRTAK